MATRGAIAALLSGGDRLHLQHGPIDLILGAEGAAPGDRTVAFQAARARFDTILAELVTELPALRKRVTVATECPRGAVARRMYHAALPHHHLDLTAMAAVAGAVADEILAAMTRSARLARAYVNNGGDIALHLTGAHRFDLAMATPQGRDLGRITLRATDRVGGIATSGLGGRSLTLGIADSVTVLARSAAAADAAATLIANAVDLPGHGAIRRAPACHIQPDSDLNARPVVTECGTLTQPEIAHALARGQSRAEAMLRAGTIRAAALFLRGQTALTGTLSVSETLTERTLAHA